MRIAVKLIMVSLASAGLALACASQPSGGGTGDRGAVRPGGRDGSVTVGQGGRRGGRGGLGRGRGAPALSPRVELRKYRFEETGEMLEYAVFASSKVRKGTKSPLVIALHGRGVHPTTIMRFVAGPAERGGYVVAAPMGYHERGWYGLYDSDRSTPPDVRAYSEKDVMNVLAFMRAEFDIDEDRIYVMGSSMGGAGALYLAVKYPDLWAAVGAGAPPIRRATHGETIDGIANIRHMPIILVHGDRDASVTVDVSRRLATYMQELGMTYDFREIPGGTHPDAIRMGAPWIFSFFDQYKRKRPT
jgi:dienelactone hydrolase